MTKHTKHARKEHRHEDEIAKTKDEEKEDHQHVIDVKEEKEHAMTVSNSVTSQGYSHALHDKLHAHDHDHDTDCGDVGEGSRGALGWRIKLNKQNSSLGIGDTPHQPLGTSELEHAAAIRIQAVARGHHSRKSKSGESADKQHSSRASKKDKVDSGDNASTR